MIDAGRRLLVLAENHAGSAPWYELAYERLTQETPFSFKKPAQLTDADTLPATCREHRGTASAPLFLVNHWINTDPVPRPANAGIVNAYEPLLRRARECERIRHRRPEPARRRLLPPRRPVPRGRRPQRLGLVAQRQVGLLAGR